MAPTMNEVLKDPHKVARMAEALKALGHPIRLRIMACLAIRGEVTVCDLARELGLPQAVVSQQLARLRLGGQIRVRPSHGYRYYSLVVPETIALLDCLTRCCEATSRAMAGTQHASDPSPPHEVT